MTKNNEKLYAMAEFVEIVGISPQTIRNYQDRGVLPDRRNPVNNYRVFTVDDVRLLQSFKSGELVKSR